MNKFINEFKKAKLNKLFLRKVSNRLLYTGSRLVGSLIDMDKLLENMALKPFALNIASTNICNARCIFCGYKHLKAKQGVMDMRIFKKAVDDFTNIGGGNVGLTPPVGEVLMDPYILERVEYCRRSPLIANIAFYTNGILLSKIDLRKLLTCGINTIIISIGGFNREDYSKIFGVDCFETLKDGIIELCEQKRILKSPTRIGLVLRTHKSIDLCIKEPAYKELTAIIDSIEYQYNYDSWNGRIKKSDLIGEMELRPNKPKNKPCSMFYADGPTILWNGDELSECRELNGDSELMLGNIMDSSLLSLFNSDKIRQMREGFANGNLPDLCVNCTHYNSVDTLRTIRLWRKSLTNKKRFYGKS